MKKLVLILALLVLPVTAAAQTRDALLTQDGTLFKIERVLEDEAPGTVRDSHLVLRVQRDGISTQEVVPATAERGGDREPALAYDADSRTLFLFWLRHGGLTSTELLFASRTDEGVWSDVEAFGGRFDLRQNLRMAVTRRVSNEDGTLDEAAAVTVHLAWWEYDSTDGHEAARYAMVTIENGTATIDESLDLAAFAREQGLSTSTDEVDARLLAQPMLFTSAAQDSVDVLFGDRTTRQFHRVTVRPTNRVTAEGRLRVPVGRSGGGVGAPKMAVSADASVEGLLGDSGRLALYTRGSERLQYSVLRDGVWSETRALALDEQITGAAAIDALRRFLSEH
jgi:hypothetical protein